MANSSCAAAGFVLWGTLIAAAPAWTQNAPPTLPPQDPRSCAAQAAPFGPPLHPFLATEQLADGRVTFRHCAPSAVKVSVESSDLIAVPGVFGQSPGINYALSKDESGLWSGTTAVPVWPGTYRFNFSVDGSRVPDPRGTAYTEHMAGVSSVLEVTGPAGEFQTWRPEVAHGTVESVYYWSKSLNARRRAHVYLPAGYDKGGGRYPVFYLVHGAGDSDDSWTSVGHAHFILDNLIAAKKAVPMIVVMPFGHTPPRASAAAAPMLNNQDFGNDLLQDLLPYVEAHYRTIDRPESRAMAGLSMGGAHTLWFGLPHADRFRYIGIFSMGLGRGDNNSVASYTTANDAALKQAAKQMKLVYYAIGRTDFLFATSAPTRQMLDQYGIRYVYHESDGGHTWLNWRDYLADFAPRLFR